MEYKPTKEDIEKLRKAERDEFLEHHLKGVHCNCVNCEMVRLRVQRGYWHKKCRDKDNELNGCLADLIMYANHLEEKYFIGTHSPFHMLVGRIVNRKKGIKPPTLKKEKCDWKLEDCKYCELGDTLTIEEQKNCPHRINTSLIIGEKK